jgi:hypothetical protein
MKEPTLIFEHDETRGVSTLKPTTGMISPLNSKDERNLIALIEPRYNNLSMRRQGTIEFQGKTIDVRVPENYSGRKPSLELRWPESAIAIANTQPQNAWFPGFVAEVDRLFATPEFDKVLRCDRAMLTLVRDELEVLSAKQTPTELSQYLLLTLLMTAEHFSRTQNSPEHDVYAPALRGLEQLIGLLPKNSNSPWGAIPAERNTGAMPSLFTRCLNNIFGAR